MPERIEQHIGTILQVMVIGLLTWSLTTTVSLRTDVGILQAQISAINATISQGTSDRYRGSDAARDMAAIWQEFDRREVRIKRLEEEMAKVRNGK